METLEMLSPAVVFYLYVLFGGVLSFVLKFIFKKSPTYYMIFLSTIALFSIFSREFVPTLPFDIMDVPRIISKSAGIFCGILFINLLMKRKTQRRKLV
jgi:hypothetical protein